MTEQATHDPAGETHDGADWPTREQLHVMDAAAVKFGSVAVERVKGTDDMRMTTPEGTVLVSEDGERQSREGIDYAAITRLRLNLEAEANRLRYGDSNTYEVGIAIHALEHATAALFDTLNVMSSYLGDKLAKEAIDAYLEAKGHVRA